MGSPTHEASMHNSHTYHNGLTNIRGIGAIRKQWFNALGIYTIADLAHASADDLEYQFKDSGRSLSRSELKEWIAQAQAQLAEVSAQPENSLDLSEESIDAHSIKSPSVVASEGVSEDVIPEDVASKDTEISAPEWNSVASFKLEYQTRFVQGKLEQRTVIHHLESGAVESQPNFENHFIQTWLLNRIKASNSSAKPEVVDRPEVIPEIIQLRVIQAHQPDLATTADKSYPLFSRAIQADEPFDLEVLIQFSGLTDTMSGEQIAYQVQCMAHDLSTGSTTDLGEVAARVSASNSGVNKVLLSELMLPNPSIYRLKVLVTLQNALATSSYFKVPMLQVV